MAAGLIRPKGKAICYFGWQPQNDHHDIPTACLVGRGYDGKWRQQDAARSYFLPDSASWLIE